MFSGVRQFDQRSLEPERIDTGDYTKEEFEKFLEEIEFINRYLGDFRAVTSAVSGVLQSKSGGATLLDVGAGSGAVLRHLASRYSFNYLVGLDNHPQSAKRISTEKAYSAIDAVQGDAFTLPFADNAFDIVICSLFLHHLTDSQIVQTLAEMRRVAKQAVIGIDLKRSPWAYWSYRAFCASFRISELVTHDGSLSIMKSFSRDELLEFGKAAGLESPRVESVFPFRWVLIG